MQLSAPIFQLKRRARLLAREHKIPLCQALDRIAREEGFAQWSLLAARAEKTSTDRNLISKLEDGDLLLVAARPRQGKTLLGLQLLMDAAREGRTSVFFTLEYSGQEVEQYFRRLGADPGNFRNLLSIVTSDEIGSEFIAGYLEGCDSGTVAVVDYLQILDQQRNKPDLDTQIRDLHDFARDRGIILVFLSQIDRSFDPAAKPLPDMSDVRMPNPIDLNIFSKTCFLHGGELRFQSVA